MGISLHSHMHETVMQLFYDNSSVGNLTTEFCVLDFVYIISWFLQVHKRETFGLDNMQQQFHLTHTIFTHLYDMAFGICRISLVYLICLYVCIENIAQ